MTDEEIISYIVTNGRKEIGCNCNFDVAKYHEKEISISVDLISESIFSEEYKTCMSLTKFKISRIKYVKSYNDWFIEITHNGVDYKTTYNFNKRTHDFYLALCINIECKYLRLLYSLLSIFPAYTANLFTKLSAPTMARMMHKVLLQLENNGLYYVESNTFKHSKSFVLSQNRQDIFLTSRKHNICTLQNSWVDFQITQRISKATRFSFYFNVKFTLNFVYSLDIDKTKESAMYILNVKAIREHGKFNNVEYHSQWLDSDNCFSEIEKNSFNSKFVKM